MKRAPPFGPRPVLMFAAVLAAELAIMSAFMLAPSLDGEVVESAGWNGVLVGAATWAAYHAFDRNGPGRGSNGLILGGVALCFELTLHVLFQALLPGDDTFAKAAANAIAVACAVGAVAAWLDTVDRRILEERALGAQPKPVAASLALGAALAALVVTATPALNGVSQARMVAAGDGATELVNLAGRQRMFSQRIGRLAMLDGPARRDELADAIAQANAQAAMLDAKTAAYVARTGAQARADALPGNADLVALRRAFLHSATIVLHAPTATTRAQAQARLQDEIDAFLPAMEAATSALQRQEAERMAGAIAVQNAALTIGPFLLFGLAIGMIWPILRLVSAQQARSAQQAGIVEATRHPIVRTDAERKITWINPAFTDLTGYSLDDARGKSPGALLQGEDTDPQTVAALRAALNAPAPIKTTILNYTRAKRPYWLEIEIQPIRDAAGALEGFQAVATDISDLVAARERESAALADARARELLLNQVCEATSIGGWKYDVANQTLTCTDSFHRLLKAAPGTLDRLENFVAFAEPDAVNRISYLIRTAVKTGEGWDIEHYARLSDGSEIWVRSIGRALRVSGRTVALLGAVSDISAEKARADALDAARRIAENANEAKSRFIATMSHELRTPLNAVLGYTELLEDEVLVGNDAALADSARIKAAARHLLELINDILDLAKIDAGQMSMDLRAADAGALISECAALVAPMAQAKGLTLGLDLAPDLGLFETDRKRFKQCVLNLLSNAVKFTDVGSVTVTARRRENGGKERLEISVRDSGCGIPADKLAELFQAFAQVDSSLSRRHDGTGVGLAITRRIARLLGGDVTVASTPGEGSTFRLTVACALASAAQAAA
jgi:PAS domain S-box-containing protein